MSAIDGVKERSKRAGEAVGRALEGDSLEDELGQAKKGWRRSRKQVKRLRKQMRKELADLPKDKDTKEGSSVLAKLMNRFTFGLGVGYVLGARAGHERYQQIVSWWNRLMRNPTIQQVTEKGKDLATHTSRTAADALRSRTSPQTVGKVMTANPETVKTTASVREAAQKMRDVNAVQSSSSTRQTMSSGSSPIATSPSAPSLRARPPLPKWRRSSARS